MMVSNIPIMLGFSPHTKNNPSNYGEDLQAIPRAARACTFTTTAGPSPSFRVSWVIYFVVNHIVWRLFKIPFWWIKMIPRRPTMVETTAIDRSPNYLREI